jgi:uncharacterized protein
MRAILCVMASLIVATAISTAANAQTVARTVQSMGLTGRWSFNCKDDGSGRFISTNARGGASFIDRPSNDQYEIIEVQSLDATTIRITFRGGTTDQRGQEASGLVYTTYRIDGRYLRTIDSRNEFGVVMTQNGLRVGDNAQIAPLEKCTGPAPLQTKAAPLPASGPSFDCSKAKSAAARLICSDAELSRLDRELGAAYKQLLGASKADEKTKVRNDQVAWIRSRNKGCGLENTNELSAEQQAAAKKCMVGSIEEQTANLEAGTKAALNQGWRGDESTRVDVTANEDVQTKVTRQKADAVSKPMRSEQDCTIEFNKKTRAGDLPSGAVLSDFLKWCLAQPAGESIEAAPAVPSPSGLPANSANVGVIDFTRVNDSGWGGVPAKHLKGINFAVRASGLKGFISCIALAPYDQGPRSIALQFLEDENARRVMIDSSLLMATLNELKRSALRECQSALKEGLLVNVGTWRPETALGSFFQIASANFQARTRDVASPWEIQRNGWADAVIAQRQAEIAARQAADERQRIANIRADNRSKIHQMLGVTGLTNYNDVNANPFVFKDKVVGLRGIFVRMLSENEAGFRSGGDYVVTGVPSTMFRGNEEVIIAVRIKGNKPVKGMSMMGPVEVSVPYGEYVNVYKCGSTNCPEYFD